MYISFVFFFNNDRLIALLNRKMVDYLSQLPVDLFFQLLSYLPFGYVEILCSSNTTLRNYGLNSRFANKWKFLIDRTFSQVHDYTSFLTQLKTDYNYLTYVRLIKIIDPVSQLMIYYQLDDRESWDEEKFGEYHRILALFLLNKKTELVSYVSGLAFEEYQYRDYLLCLDMMDGKSVSQEDLDRMATEMAGQGNMKGLLLMQERGANVDEDEALSLACENGHLNVVKYLVENGANIHVGIERPLRSACREGHLKVVKYLVEHGANIRETNDEYALVVAAEEGHLAVVQYLVEQGAHIQGQYNEALRSACRYGHLAVVQYLVEQGADIQVNDDEEDPLVSAAAGGHLAIIQYLKEQGADIHMDMEHALKSASRYGHLAIVKYLVEQGADIHIEDELVLMIAAERGYLKLVKYLVEQGADITVNNNIARRSASAWSHPAVVKYLTEQELLIKNNQ